MDTRDTLFLGLHELGVRTRLAKRGDNRERIGEGLSLGVIELDMLPLQWAHVRRLDEGSAVMSEVDLGVPDMRLRKMPETAGIAIRTDPAGSNDGARWTGNDLGLGLLHALNTYPALNRELRFTRKPLPLYFGQREADPSVRITAQPKLACWTITLPVRLEMNVTGLFAGRKTRIPTAEELACYREIGRLLLNSPLSTYWESESPQAISA